MGGEGGVIGTGAPNDHPFTHCIALYKEKSTEGYLLSHKTECSCTCERGYILIITSLWLMLYFNINMGGASSFTSIQWDSSSILDLLLSIYKAAYLALGVAEENISSLRSM